MISDADNHEALREALLNLNRLRVEEKSARLQMETLVDGIKVLNECQSVSDMYREILVCLNRLIEFDCATILVEESSGSLSSAVSSDQRLGFKRIPIEGVFKRCLNGRSTTLTNLLASKEWPVPSATPADQQSHDAEEKRPLKSALMVSLPALTNRMMLICASETESKFKRSELDLLRSFAPLATQAVRRALEMEKLSYLANTLDHQAHFDLLTGLPNRFFYEQKLDALDKSRKRYSIMFLDLDNFKSINDTFGHAAGDILLSEIAFRMSAVVSANDIVARMGGDEFALIIQSRNTPQQVESLCTELLDEIRKPLYLRSSRIAPSASIGVLHALQSDNSSQQNMLKADIAMYSAKEQGRNRYCFFNDAMKRQVQTEFEIESQLPLAIKQEQFHLVYQPIFCSKSMHCERVEVLVRWSEEFGAGCGPDCFIPIAEKTGNIVELGEWILKQSLAEFGPWLSQAATNTLSINVSQVQLQQEGFVSSFLQSVSSAKVNCAQLELELSENFILACIDEPLSTNLRILNTHGVRFAFDDFGTGSSSLLHLQKFPGTCLKIDKSFIDDIVSSQDQRRLIVGMIDFAHHLGMHVVAEGVESDEQLNVLCGVGADYIQGYLLARPDRAENILPLLAHWRTDATPGYRNAVGS